MTNCCTWSQVTCLAKQPQKMHITFHFKYLSSPSAVQSNVERRAATVSSTHTVFPSAIHCDFNIPTLLMLFITDTNPLLQR